VGRRVARFAELSPQPLTLPTDNPRPREFTYRGAEVRCFVKEDHLCRAEAAARRHGVTLFELMLALFAAVLCRSANQAKIVIGVPHHSREPETLGIVGCLMNVLLACCALPEGMQLGQLLEAVHKEMAGAHRDWSAPLLEVLAELRARELVRPDSSRCGAYQAVCNMWHDVEARGACEADELLPDGIKLRVPEESLRCVGGQVDVQLEIRHDKAKTGRAMALVFGYCPDLHTEAQAELWLADLVDMIRHMGCTESCKVDLWQAPLNRREAVSPVTPTHIRELVAGTLPAGEFLENESSFMHAGLESTSAAFLHARLSSLMGRRLSPSVAFDHPTLSSLTAALMVGVDPQGGSGGSASSSQPREEPKPVKPGEVRVRPVADGDWHALRELWSRHHHLVEMVPFTSGLLVTGPPAWIVVLGAAVAAGRRDPARPDLSWLKVLLGYLVLVGIQHLVHLVFARMALRYDLDHGELSPTGWARKHSQRPGVMLVAEAVRPGCESAAAMRDQPFDVVGVVCVRLESLCGKCPQRKKARRKARGSPTRSAAPAAAASLWHAAVRPQWRNQGTAAALLSSAEAWALEQGATSLEALCLNTAAKAACWNCGFVLRNGWSGRLPLLPGVFAKELGR